MAQVATIESTELPPNPQSLTPEQQDQDQDQPIESQPIDSQSQIDDNKESPTTTTATTNTERCTGEFVYTRAAILQLFKRYPLPKGFVQLNHITSKEPLAPLALAPTQEHPDDTGQSKFSSAKHRQHRGRGRGDVLRSSWSPGLDYLKSSIGGTNPSNRFSDVNRDVYGNLTSSLRTEDSNGSGASVLSSSVDQLFAQQDEDEEWEYKDNFGRTQGPFSASQMNGWYREGYFSKDILLRSSFDKEFLTLAVRLLGSPNPFANNRRSQPSQPQSPHLFNLSLSLEQEYDGRNVISSLSNSIDSNDLSASGQDEASNQNSIVNLLLRASLRASQEHQPVSSTSSESSPATTTSVTHESPSAPETSSNAPQSAPSSDVQESSGNTIVPQGNWLEQLFEKAEKARTSSPSSTTPSSAPATGQSQAPVKEGVWNVDQVEALSSGGNPSELNLSANWLVNSTSENGTLYQPQFQPPTFQPPPQNFVWSSLSCSTEELFPPSPAPAFNTWEMFPGSYPPEQQNSGHYNNNNNNNSHFNPRREHGHRGQSHRGGRGGRGGGFRGGRGGRGGGSRGYYQKH